MSNKLRRQELAIFSRLAHVMIIATLGIVAGRIAVVRSVEGDTAFLSANDRSRWCTVAALVEDGTYEIDRLVEIKDRSGRRRPWSSIDRVRHTGTDGQMHYYSSKPPLFPTLVAGVYWIVSVVSGMTLTEQPIYVARMVLALVNLPMLAVMLLAVWHSIRESFVPDEVKLYGLAVACFGTALFPMAISLNNHLPAAMATAVVLAIYLSTAGIARMRRIELPYFFAGAAAAYAVANELPALAMMVCWTILFARQHVLATLVGFLPGACFVAAIFLFTNLLAHHSLRPPYMHRSDGGIIATVESERGQNRPPSVIQLNSALQNVPDLRTAAHSIILVPSGSPDRWIIEANRGTQRAALRLDESSGGNRWNVHAWDNWYDYPGSYWTKTRPGVDAGEPSRLVYLLQITFGFYGLFSLTPVWLLVPYGLRLRLREGQGHYRWFLAGAVALVTITCLVFYVSRPLIDRNYGGVSCSFRWMLWFMPLWVWAMVPALARMLQDRWQRPLAILLLAMSIFSAATALDNPWQHPWIYRFIEFLGWQLL